MDAPSSNWVDIAGYKVIYSETDADYDYNSGLQYLYVSTDTSVTQLLCLGQIILKTRLWNFK